MTITESELAGRFVRCNADGTIAWNKPNIGIAERVDRYAVALREIIGNERNEQELLRRLPFGHDAASRPAERILQIVRSNATTASEELDRFDVLLGAVARSLVFRESMLDELPLLVRATREENALVVSAHLWPNAPQERNLLLAVIESDVLVLIRATRVIPHDLDADVLVVLDSTELCTITIPGIGGIPLIDSRDHDLVDLIAEMRLRAPWQEHELIQDQMLGAIRSVQHLANDPLSDPHTLIEWMQQTTSGGERLRPDFPLVRSCISDVVVELNGEHSRDQLAMIVERELADRGVSMLHARVRGEREEQFSAVVERIGKHIDAAVQACTDLPLELTLGQRTNQITPSGIVIGVARNTDRIAHAVIEYSWLRSEQGRAGRKRRPDWMHAATEGSCAVIVHVTLENRAHARMFSTGIIDTVAQLGPPRMIVSKQSSLHGFTARRQPSKLALVLAQDRIMQWRSTYEAQRQVLAEFLDKPAYTALNRSFCNEAERIEQYCLRSERDRELRYNRSFGLVIVCVVGWTTAISAVADAIGLREGISLTGGAALTLLPPVAVGLVLWLWYHAADRSLLRR